MFRGVSKTENRELKDSSCIADALLFFCTKGNFIFYCTKNTVMRMHAARKMLPDGNRAQRENPIAHKSGGACRHMLRINDMINITNIIYINYY